MLARRSTLSQWRRRRDRKSVGRKKKKKRKERDEREGTKLCIVFKRKERKIYPLDIKIDRETLILVTVVFCNFIWSYFFFFFPNPLRFFDSSSASSTSLHRVENFLPRSFERHTRKYNSISNLVKGLYNYIILFEKTFGTKLGIRKNSKNVAEVELKL